MYTYFQAYVCIHSYLYANTYARTYTLKSIRMNTFLSIRKYTRMIHIHTVTQTCTSMLCTYAHTYTLHIHMHILICILAYIKQTQTRAHTQTHTHTYAHSYTVRMDCVDARGVSEPCRSVPGAVCRRRKHERCRLCESPKHISESYV